MQHKAFDSDKDFIKELMQGSRQVGGIDIPNIGSKALAQACEALDGPSHTRENHGKDTERRKA